MRSPSRWHAEAAGGQGGALWRIRDELRTRLRVVLASRLSQFDADQTNTNAQIGTLGTQIETQAGDLETMDAEHTEGVRHGYALDQQIRETNTTANQTAVELERVIARSAGNKDRVAELTQPHCAGSGRPGRRARAACHAVRGPGAA